MRWLKGLFGKRKREKELDEEVRCHLEMAAREREERGEASVEAEPQLAASSATWG